jgi:hypothetical protein
MNKTKINKQALMAAGPLHAPEPAWPAQTQHREGTDTRVPAVIGTEAGDGGSPPISRRRRGLRGNQGHRHALRIKVILRRYHGQLGSAQDGSPSAMAGDGARWWCTSDHRAWLHARRASTCSGSHGGAIETTNVTIEW